jgi:RNA polymerase sigma-70 factor (ECF subfamily)
VAPLEPDARTVEKAAKRDVQAFEQLYRAYAGRVYALCRRLSGDPVRAEDLVQETFLRVWERLDSFEARSRFTTWLYRLTVNRATDLLRPEIRRSLHETSEEPARDLLPAARSGDPGLRIDLEAAIAALPAGARYVFVLHDVEGYGHEEIAELGGFTVGTSKSQLYRARRLLREILSR